ncbi:hypothetical protein JTE90_010433 [Oedothorax gibbosus]|uniref:Uncharacterized protein n=1 Tax=Oedothorax gibbosus TaxID=931172 RepID=A0AAV6VZT3_9ARAC|nr:hypothetical protein JTE90_010433 [Oedothorax gibbosus]
MKIAWSAPLHRGESIFERYASGMFLVENRDYTAFAHNEPWNVEFRHEHENPHIYWDRNLEENPSYYGHSGRRNRGTTESTSTEQFTTITTLFYG